jgi:AcrR family transcriptional regulator
MTEAPGPHHHGNLRSALIEAALEILQDDGAEGLTLRRVAARAGVSHAAPAHHFAGLHGLLTAIAARAFALFTEAMETARDSAGPAPFDRLAGVCEGYLAFARTSAGLFRVMFNTPGLHRDDPDLARHSQAAYQVLRDACTPFAGERPEELELAVWSMVHGYAALGFAEPQEPGQPFGTPPPFRPLLARLIGDLPLARGETLG